MGLHNGLGYVIMTMLSVYCLSYMQQQLHQNFFTPEILCFAVEHILLEFIIISITAVTPLP